MTKKSRTPDETSIQPPNPLRFEVYRNSVNQKSWRLRGKNNKTVAIAGEGYHNEADMLAAIDLVKKYAADAPIKKARK